MPSHCNSWPLHNLIIADSSTNLPIQLLALFLGSIQLHFLLACLLVLDAPDLVQTKVISLQFLTVAAGMYPQNCRLIYQFDSSDSCLGNVTLFVWTNNQIQQRCKRSCPCSSWAIPKELVLDAPDLPAKQIFSLRFLSAGACIPSKLQTHLPIWFLALLFKGYDWTHFSSELTTPVLAGPTQKS